MFTTPCFIRKNTSELREKLEKLGYKICPCALFYDACWLDTNVETVHGIGYSDETYPLPQEEVLKRFLAENKISNTPLIDCGDNEELFLALAALRDDNDYMQWFVLDEQQQWVNIDRWINVGDMFIVMTEHNQGDWKCHKATIEEIIEYFTMKGGAE